MDHMKQNKLSRDNLGRGFLFKENQFNIKEYERYAKSNLSEKYLVVLICQMWPESAV